MERMRIASWNPGRLIQGGIARASVNTNLQTITTLNCLELSIQYTIPFESSPDACFRCSRFYVHQATVLNFRTLKQLIKIPRMLAKHWYYRDSVPDVLGAVNFRRFSLHQRIVSQYTGSLGYRPDFCVCLVDFIQKQLNLYPVPNSRVGAVTVLSGRNAGE